MDARDLASYVFEDAGFQLGQVLQGFPSPAFDQKLNDLEMTPKDTVVHLTEAYVAGQKQIKGARHSWGTYAATSDDQDALVETMKQERAAFWNAAEESGDPTQYKTAMLYGSNHDYYHVGQLCTMRRAVDPAWDSDSIYR